MPVQVIRRPKKPSKKKRRRRLHRIVGVFCILLGIWLIVYSLFFRVTKAKPAPKQIAGIPVVTELVPKGSEGRPGTVRRVTYLVIHETGNHAAGANAASHSRYLLSGQSGSTSWHYTVDDHEIYHHIPDNEVAWQAGEHEGNLHGIGIELCVNEDGNFEKTFQNGAKLAAYLLNEYHLSIDHVKQHGDFIDKNCPQTIRETNRWQEFLNLIQLYQEKVQ